MKLSKDKLFSILKNPIMWKSNDVLANCPECDKREFYISLNENHPFNCVRKKKCGFQGNIYTLLNKLGIKEESNFKPDVKWSSNVQNTLLDGVEDTINIDLQEIALPLGFRRIYNDSYLNKRGFIKDDYDIYQVGITNLDRSLINYIIFVIYNDFKPVATIGRFKGTKEECELLKKPRYKNSESDFEKILGGYDELEKDVTETVILVEGLFDAKNIIDLLDLKNNSSTKCCYTFKCHVSDAQLYKLQLKGIKKILLMYDSDVLDKIKETAMQLSKHFEVQIAHIECKNENGEIKDPGDLNIKELQCVLHTTFTPLEFYTKKVQILDL